MTPGRTNRSGSRSRTSTARCSRPPSPRIPSGSRPVPARARFCSGTSTNRRILEPPIEGDEGMIGGVAYSPDGTLLATSRTGFSTTQLWRADDRARFAGTFIPGALPYHRADIHPQPLPPQPSHLFTERRPTRDHRTEPRDRLLDAGSRSVARRRLAIAGRELTEGEWRQYLPDRDPYPLCEGE